MVKNIRFLIFLFFASPAFAEVPATAAADLWGYGELVGGIALAVLQGLIGWWAIKKILLVAATGGGRFPRL
jgi:hypothetical protein